MTHHLSRRILTQVSKSVKSKIGNLDKPQSHEQRSVYIKGWRRKHILNMLTSARKSCLGLKEYTQRPATITATKYRKTDFCSLQQKTSCGGQHAYDRELLSRGQGRKGWDFPHLISCFPVSSTLKYHKSMAGLSHSYTFLYPTSNWNSGLSGRERQMNACLHSRHNKAQNTAQRLL